jgi:hypothetical protein
MGCANVLGFARFGFKKTADSNRRAPMSNNSSRGLDDLHKAVAGGPGVLIRQLQPEDAALYPEFLRAT